MSTTKCGPELELVHAGRGAETRISAAMLRTKSVWRAIRNRLAANNLYDLDERQLNDIGITRHDLLKALDHSGVLEDPSRLLAGAARKRAATRFERKVHP